MLTVFGSIAVGIMFLAWWLEPRSRWYILIFAGGSAATALYSGLAEVYPIMVIESLWTVVALWRFARAMPPRAIEST
jgi:hypothetical protein